MPARLLTSLLLLMPPDTALRADARRLDVAARADTVADTTWYVTNRARRDGRATRVAADSLEFGYVVFRFAETKATSANDRLMGRVRGQRADSVTLTRAEFVRRLRESDARAAVRKDGAVFYVHGFATSFGRAMSQSAEIAYRGSFGGPFIAFSWPAHTALATWPTPGAIISRAYRQDSAVAHASEGALREALMVVRSAVRPAALTVVGHSLGAQLVAEALRKKSPEHDALTRAPLRALVFFSADISATWFHDSVGPSVAPLAARRVVYSSASDRMLAISHVVNHTPRVGQTGTARVLTDAGVEVVDVTRAARSRAPWPAVFDPHHAMRLSGTALYDFFYGVVRGESAACRVYDGLASRDASGVYRMQPAAVPTAATSCAATGL